MAKLANPNHILPEPKVSTVVLKVEQAADIVYAYFVFFAAFFPKLHVVVATIAFGMGIDKLNVRRMLKLRILLKLIGFCTSYKAEIVMAPLVTGCYRLDLAGLGSELSSVVGDEASSTFEEDKPEEEEKRNIATATCKWLQLDIIPCFHANTKLGGLKSCVSSVLQGGSHIFTRSNELNCNRTPISDTPICTRGRRRMASRHCKATPYPLLACREKKSINAIPKKEKEDITCSVCMEYPHNAFLLLCSSHDKGCRPYMCVNMLANIAARDVDGPLEIKMQRKWKDKSMLLITTIEAQGIYLEISIGSKAEKELPGGNEGHGRGRKRLMSDGKDVVVNEQQTVSN
ncbi:hypothetical protein CTI12_AA125140 [Artemisia annua]|uniref:Uncharacterized protein n=1 Tax=Artemisia annua TaxID=35608 RepID=A0A2U1P9V4_ARTAN|nr:hypothetical protein CTI12_AA125140 [Artemisia annua]